VQRVRLADGHPAWVVLGYEAARQALGDPRISKDMVAALEANGDVVAEGLPGPEFSRHMLNVDAKRRSPADDLVSVLVAAEDDALTTQEGRPVTVPAGEHVRLPRAYRGRDIFWWLQATGLLAERYDEIDDLTRARHLPSPQLTGTAAAAITDLNALAARGVRIVRRLGRITDGVAQFSGSLANTCALADLKMNRFLNRADEWATAAGLDGVLPPPHRFEPTRVDTRAPLELDLSGGEIATVLWATGFRADHSWLDIPVRDRTGRIRHDGGVVTGAPGLYVLGLPVLRTRASTYIHGAGTGLRGPGRPPARLPRAPAVTGSRMAAEPMLKLACCR
jgi:hypothetical protein